MQYQTSNEQVMRRPSPMTSSMSKVTCPCSIFILLLSFMFLTRCQQNTERLVLILIPSFNSSKKFRSTFFTQNLDSQSVMQRVQYSFYFCFFSSSRIYCLPNVNFLFVLSIRLSTSLSSKADEGIYYFFIILIKYYQFIGSNHIFRKILSENSFKESRMVITYQVQKQAYIYKIERLRQLVIQVNMKNLILQEIRQLKVKNPIKVIPPQQQPKDDVLSEKSSISGKSSKTQSIIRSGQELFKGKKFCFPLIDLELSPKRVQIMTKSIRIEEGIVVVFQDRQIEEVIDYLLVSPNAKIEAVLKKVHNKIEFKDILDFNFVLNTLRQGILLASQKYSLYSNPKYAEQPLDDTVIISVQLRKKNKVESNEKIDYFSQKFNEKLQAHTDDQNEDDFIQLKTKSETETLQVKTNLMQSCKRLLNDKQKPKYEISKNMFLCQKSITQESIQKFSMNKFICEQLMKLQKIYESQKDVGRKIAYLKAVSAIKSLNFEIQSQSDLENVKGIGKKIVDKVKQLIRTGRLEKLEKLQHNQRNKAETDFCKVWGIGPSTAQQLYKQGIKTIQQLRERTDLLNKNQRLGLRYYEDFLKKIPREKISRIFQQIKLVFSQMVDSIDNYRIEVCGSYRRGRQMCGDIDIIISRKDGYYEKKLLLNFILQLEQNGFLIDHLQFPSGMENRSSLSYMGICKFQDEIHHRIDIKYYPTEEYAYALLYFTGSDMFNRSMRLYARKVGLQLSDHGAHPRRDERTGAIWEKSIPFCETQKDIFEWMGLQYKTPKERQV